MGRITLIGHLQIRDGQRASSDGVAKQIMALVKATEPGVLTYDWHVGADGAVDAFEVYEDSDALIAHMTGEAGSRLPEVFEFSALSSIDLYGELSDKAKEVTAAFPIVDHGAPAFSAT